VTHVPRLLPDRPLPPYAFIGGGPRPHPRRDPDGHSHGEPEPEPGPLDPDAWESSAAYLRGIDLFNHGYYWEAHEQWEALWLAAGRRGPVAEFLKALIKLTAAGVKIRQGRPRGVRSHTRRALRHVDRVRSAGEGPVFAGLDLDTLTGLLEELSASADFHTSPRLEASVEVVVPRPLLPR
jgi:hypothetical protein